MNFTASIPSAIHGLRNGDLCVLWVKPRAFGIISLHACSYIDKVYVEKDNGGKLIKHNRFMAVDEDRCHVICPSREKDTKATQGSIISCYDFIGVRIFENIYAEIKDPRGIALDADGNIYICDQVLGGIHVLSPEGLRIRMIQDGCPKRPLGIGFNKSINLFAVTQGNPDYQQVVMFSVGPP